MRALAERIHAVLSGINTGFIMLSGWGILLITVLTTYSVTMRYVFNAPDIWTYPLSAYILCFVVFASLAHTHQDGVHVRVDYVLQILPRPLAILLRIVGDVASSVFLALFAWYMWKLLNETIARNRVDETTLGLPLVFIQWILPLGAGLLLLTHLALAFRAAATGRYGREEPGAPH